MGGLYQIPSKCLKLGEEKLRARVQVAEKPFSEARELVEADEFSFRLRDNTSAEDMELGRAAAIHRVARLNH